MSGDATEAFEDISEEDYNVWTRDRVTKIVARDTEKQISLLRQGAIELYDSPVKIAKLKGKIDAYYEMLNWLKG